ncbi:MAG: DUF2849 domain-containing protein [Rhodospirillales bacterium]|jgi:hypothetical protein|nr:DUF2849 domain-containing protein [Rhodospirillales bacterium]
MTTQIVTANRLIDGLVVYFTSDDTWSQWIADAHISIEESKAQASLSLALASVAHSEVVDAYLIDVVTEASTIKPVRYRETIRAKGPSVSTSLPHIPAGRSNVDSSAFLNGV